MSRKNILITIFVILLIVLAFMGWKKYGGKEEPTEIVANHNSVTNNTNTSVNNSNQDSQSNNQFDNDLKTNGTAWTLWQVTLNKQVLNLNSTNIPAPLNIQFDTSAHTFSGFSGCNNFSGHYLLSSNEMSFSFGIIATSKNNCTVAQQNLENKILEAMNQVKTYGIKGEQLAFTSADGYTEVTFNPAK